MAFLSPLRYPGGKRKLANFVKLVIRYNGLMDGCYVEPYAGGSAVALELLFDEYVSRIVINDYSRPIYAFWHSVLYETDTLCQRIIETDISLDEWYVQKSIYARLASVSLLDLGFATLFLNRTNRSGIISGGVIGGKSQKGKYKIDARFNKNTLIQRIRRIARYRNRIYLYNKDAVELLETLSPTLPEKTLLFLDPPYYQKGKMLYDDHYQHQDHVQIAKTLRALPIPWIISYDDVPEIRELYREYPNITYGLHYSASTRYQGQEIMFFHKDLAYPSLKKPSRIDNKRLNAWLQMSMFNEAPA